MIDDIETKIAPILRKEGIVSPAAKLSSKALISLVRSATEAFSQMALAANEAHSKKLIIDLRQNSGGNSAIGVILAYFILSP